MTESSRAEKLAMVGDKAAALRVVSALRAYRKMTVELLKGRYADGEVDAVALTNHAWGVVAIEEEQGNGEG